MTKRNPNPSSLPLSHWAKLPLDDYACLLLKDIKSSGELTYKILDPGGTLIEGPTKTYWTLEGGKVLIGSAQIDWGTYQRVCNVLQADLEPELA